MRIKDILLQQEAPKYATVAWAKPTNDSVQLNIYNKGEWHPVNGSGNSGSSSSSSCNCWDVEIVVKGNSDNNMQAILRKGDFNNIMGRLLDGVPFTARVINATAAGTWTELPVMHIDPTDPQDESPRIYIAQRTGKRMTWNSDNTLTLVDNGSIAPGADIQR